MLNGLALAVFSFLPANQETVVHKWIYQASMESPIEIVAHGENPYENGLGTIGFFRSPKVSFHEAGSPDELLAYLENVKESVCVCAYGVSAGRDACALSGFRSRVECLAAMASAGRPAAMAFEGSPLEYLSVLLTPPH